MARKCLLALTILLNAFQLASAAVITLPTANLTMPVANLTGPAANFCTDEPNWIGSGAYGLDCIGAVQRLYDTEIRSRRWPKSDFEFLTPKARESQIEAMRTPRKYTVSKDITDQDVEPDIIWETDNVEDTCTVAIVMLNYFSDTDLPGGIAGPFASRDVTSFWEIWEAARQIESVCVIHSGKPGWAAEGTTLHFPHKSHGTMCLYHET